MVATLDRLMARLLFVKPITTQSEAALTENAERAFSLSLLVSGVRCILTYVVLPFILPIIGLAGAFSAYISLFINIIAIGAIFYSLRRFWQIDYPRKWQYLPVALVALVIIVSFIVLDISEIIA